MQQSIGIKNRLISAGLHHVVLGSETEPFPPHWGIFRLLAVSHFCMAVMDFIGVVSDIRIEIRLQADYIRTLADDFH